MLGMIAGAYVIWDLGPDGRGHGRRAWRASAARASGHRTRRGRHAHAVVRPDAPDRRAAGRGDQRLRLEARRRLQGARVDEPPAQGVLVQGRGHRPLQPAVLHHAARRGARPLPALQSPRLRRAPGPRRLQGRERRPRPRRGRRDLRDIAQILQKHSRGINVVSRYGGDEFAILLVETSKAGARLYADRIRQVIGSFPFSHGKQITASLGVASVPDDEAGNGRRSLPRGRRSALRRQTRGEEPGGGHRSS